MSGIKDLKPVKYGHFKQGYYDPIYPQKYKTNTKQIIFRSSWEYKLCKWFDLTPEVIEWASEPLSIKYFYNVDQKYVCQKPKRKKSRNRENMVSGRGKERKGGKHCVLRTVSVNCTEPLLVIMSH